MFLDFVPLYGAITSADLSLVAMVTSACDVTKGVPPAPVPGSVHDG